MNQDKRLTKIAIPVALQNLMLALVAVSDALMLGNIEQNAMSAVSLATQVQFIQNIFFFAMVGAGAILGAQYWGKKDTFSFRDVYNTLLRLTVLTSVIFCLLCELAPGFLMRLFTNEPALIEIGVSYLKIAGWSYLFVGTSQSLLSLMKVSDHVKTTVVISVGTVVLNIILNAVLIYGLFGLPRMEAEGAALATLIVRILEFIISAGIVFCKGYTAPNLKRLFVWNRPLVGDYLKCFLPLFGAGLLWGVGFTAYSAFMGHLGEDAAAASSVCAVVRDCVCCVTEGLATGAGIVIGNELGAGNLPGAQKYGDRIVKIAFIAGILSAVLMFLLTFPVTGFVKLTEEAGKLLYGMMVVMSVYMIGRCVNTIVINGIFAAGGDTMFDLYSLAITMWGLAIPLAALGTFLFHFNPVLVYACTCLDEVGKIPWTIQHYRKYKWVRDLTR